MLVASGFIVGESLFNVFYAGLIAGTQNPGIISLPNPPSELFGMGLALNERAFLPHDWAPRP